MELYYDTIYRILERNTKANKVISPKHLTEVFYLVVEKENLRRYVNFLMFVDKFNSKEDSTAMFSVQDRTIIMNKQLMETFRKGMGDGSKFKGLDLSLFLDECLVYLLLHELEHVKQTKYLVESTDHDYKYELLRMSNIYNYIHDMRTLYGDEHITSYYGKPIEEYYGEDYKKFVGQVAALDRSFKRVYDFDPSEIEAEYRAIDAVCSFDQSVKLKKEWIRIFTNYVEDYYTDKHNHLVFPLAEYIKRRNKILTLDKVRIEDFEDYSIPLESRLSFGMPIKKKEFYSIEDTFKRHL